MSRPWALVLWGVAAPALAQTDTFHGWSKDGTYFVYESHEPRSELVELFFCASDSASKPSWPALLDELGRVDGLNSCVRFIDPNKAPYQWKAALVRPAPNAKHGALSVLAELVTDGETPGFVIESNGKKQSCEVSGLKEDSRLGPVFWHPNGKWVAALVDGRLAHCAVQLKSAPNTTKAPKRK